MIFNWSVFRSQKGQLIVEILVTMGLFAVMAPALLTGFTSVSQSKVQQEQITDSTALLNETQEAVRAVREKGWSSISTNGTYHPTQANGVWSLTSGTDTVGNLTRSVTVSDVYRDSSGNIASSGTLDPSTKKVVSSISWSVPRTASISATQYFTRYLDNLTDIDTTDSHFNGTVSNASGSSTTNVRVKKYSDDGHVELTGVSNGDWCNPTGYIVAQMNLSSSGAARDVKAVPGLAYTGTSSGTGTFVQIGINDDDPPKLTNISTLSGYATNDVFIADNYAYIATGNKSKDVVIIDMATNTEVGTFDDGYTNRTAQGVYVVGNVGYVTAGMYLYAFDLTSKTGVRPVLGSVCLSNPCGSDPTLQAGYRFVVQDNYAYLAIDSNVPTAPLWEFAIVNVSNPAAMSITGGVSVNRQAGREVALSADGTRAYLATSRASNDSESNLEVWILNTSNKSSPTKIAGYETNNMDPKGITVVDNRMIVVGTSGEEYQVINIANESSLVRCGGLQVNNGIYGVASIKESDDQAYSYIVTGDSSNEFKVILGGPGGNGTKYVPSGTYESPIFDATTTTAFNRVDGTLYIPASTSLSYQVAVANAVSGSCANATYTYLGPDGTSGTTYTSAGGGIPFKTSGSYSNPGRCFRYKANFTSSDTATSSALNDLRINYSP